MKYFVISILLMPIMAYGNPGSWTPSYQKISEIIIEGAEDDGRALVALEGGVPSSHIPPECNSIYNTITLNNDKGKSMYSTVLAAYMSGKSVRVALSCIGNRPLITHLRIN